MTTTIQRLHSQPRFSECVKQALAGVELCDGGFSSCHLCECHTTQPTHYFTPSFLPLHWHTHIWVMRQTALGLFFSLITANKAIFLRWCRPLTSFGRLKGQGSFTTCCYHTDNGWRVDDVLARAWTKIQRRNWLTDHIQTRDPCRLTSDTRHQSRCAQHHFRS